MCGHPTPTTVLLSSSCLLFSSHQLFCPLAIPPSIRLCIASLLLRNFVVPHTRTPISCIVALTGARCPFFAVLIFGTSRIPFNSSFLVLCLFEPLIHPAALRLFFLSNDATGSRPVRADVFSMCTESSQANFRILFFHFIYFTGWAPVFPDRGQPDVPFCV